VQVLLSAGAAQKGKALRTAASAGHTATVQVLLAAGADAHALRDEALRAGARPRRPVRCARVTCHEDMPLCC
jgi:hypothetical protein